MKPYELYEWNSTEELPYVCLVSTCCEEPPKWELRQELDGRYTGRCSSCMEYAEFKQENI